MIEHSVRTHRGDERLTREDQLAWKIVEVATDPVDVGSDVTEMVINRFIDNAGVAAECATTGPTVIRPFAFGSELELAA